MYVVASQGRTATTWLTVALNLHPEISCAHGPRLPLAFRDVKAMKAGVLLRDPVELASYGEGGARFRAATIADIVADGHAQAPEGNRLTLVHALNAYELFHKAKAESYAGAFRAVNVVRHPISRTQSYYAQFFRSRNNPRFQTDMATTRQNSRYYQRWASVAQELDVDLDNEENWLWILAMVWTANDFNDLEMDIPHLPYERIISDIDFFAWFVRALYGPNLPISAQFLQQVQELGQLNETSSRQSVIEIFASWPEWKRALFKLFAVENHLRQRYRPFDYSFDVLFRGDGYFV
jgi:hypothetical protein